jgi:hypothetical protein
MQVMPGIMIEANDNIAMHEERHRESQPMQVGQLGPISGKPMQRLQSVGPSARAMGTASAAERIVLLQAPNAAHLTEEGFHGASVPWIEGGLVAGLLGKPAESGVQTAQPDRVRAAPAPATALQQLPATLHPDMLDDPPALHPQQRMLQVQPAPAPAPAPAPGPAMEAAATGDQPSTRPAKTCSSLRHILATFEPSNMDELIFLIAALHTTLAVNKWEDGEVGFSTSHARPLHRRWTVGRVPCAYAKSS